jgi:hypothetical protein
MERFGQLMLIDVARSKLFYSGTAVMEADVMTWNDLDYSWPYKLYLVVASCSGGTKRIFYVT